MKTKAQQILKPILLIVLMVIVILLLSAVRESMKCGKITNNDKINLLESDTLIGVQVVFRHGMRTPEPGAIYPNDPHFNHSFYPENYGDLTNRGRKHSYLLGKSLRDRYSEFLGENYYPALVKSSTSGYDRTQMTLQCVLAGLFPNSKSITGIPWRPIIFEQIDLKDDNVIAVAKSCNLKVPTTKPPDNETIQLFKYLSEKAGIKIETYFDILHVSNNFEAEEASKLELPDWGKALYPEPLISIDNIAWFEWVKENLRNAAAGLLKTITDNAVNFASNQNDPSEYITTKIELFSGHDYNLQTLLFVLGVRNVSTTYNAHLIFELHRINAVYGFKIFFNNFRNGKLVQVDVSYCRNATKVDKFCPLDIFIHHTRWFYEPLPPCPKSFV